MPHHFPLLKNFFIFTWSMFKISRKLSYRNEAVLEEVLGVMTIRELSAFQNVVHRHPEAQTNYSSPFTFVSFLKTILTIK